MTSLHYSDYKYIYKIYNIKQIKMEKYNYRAKLVKVVDGDTIDALIDVGFDIWIKKRIRYKGIDTWESRTRDLDEKKKGVAAKARNK